MFPPPDKGIGYTKPRQKITKSDGPPLDAGLSMGQRQPTKAAPRVPVVNMVRPTGPTPTAPKNIQPAIKPTQIMPPRPYNNPNVVPTPRYNPNPPTPNPPKPRMAAPQENLPPPPSGTFIGNTKRMLEDKWDIENEAVQKQYFPGFQRTNSDNTYSNALKHAGVAANLAAKYGPYPGLVGGTIHELAGLSKYVLRDPRQWGTRPLTTDGQPQPFGLAEDLRRAWMDTRNNWVGTAIGTGTNLGLLTAKQQQQAIMWALKNRVLQVLEGPQYPQPNNYRPGR